MRRMSTRPRTSWARLVAAAASAALLAVTAGCSEVRSGDPQDETGAPPTTTSLIEQGLARIASGDPDGAAESFESVLALDPPNVYAHYNLGYLAQQAGDTEGAIAAYSAALDSDDDFAPALYNLALLTEGADLRAAITLYRRELEVDPRDAAGRYRLGRALISIGQVTRGRAMVRRAVALDPSLVR